MRTLSDRARDSLSAEATEEVWVVLLTIDHAEIDPPIRVCSNNENVISRGDTFIPYQFELELPGQAPDSPGEARLTIDNVDRLIVQTIRSITSPATVKIELVLAATPNVVEMALPPMILRDVTYDVNQVTGALRFEDLVTEPLADTITPSRFPGLF